MLSQTMCTSFKVELFGGIHDLDTDTMKMALYTSAASLGASTTAYTTSGEVSGTGYSAGGATVTGVTISSDGTVGYVTFSNVIWPASIIVARGALLYNSSKANRAIAVIDFGADKASNGSDFTIQIPAAGANTAILRIV